MGRRANLDTPTKKWFWKIIKRIGGVKATAKLVCVTTGQVYAWVRKEQVPEDYILPFVKVANMKEVYLTERQLIDFSLKLLVINEGEE